MLKALIKKQLLELFQTYYVDKKKGKARSKTGTVLFFLLLVLLFSGLGLVFYTLACGIGAVILGRGINWLYFALMGLLSMALGVFGSVFNTYASVYLPKDNELLLSLPIPGRTLLLARLSGVYATSLMYSAWIWIPITIAYWGMGPVNARNILFPILMTFLLALFVSILSCLLGWMVALIASKVKGNSIMTLFFSLAVFALYYIAYFKIVGSLNEIADHVDSLGKAVRSKLHFSYLIGKAADGDILSMLLFSAITLTFAWLCFLVLSKSFLNLSTAGSSCSKRMTRAPDYSKKEVRASLLQREYRHFLSVPTWMLNGGFGLLLLPVAAITLLIKSKTIQTALQEVAAELPDFSALLPVLFPAAVCLLLSMNAILPVSVSMEGKTLWQLQSLPIDPWQILRAKEDMAAQLNLIPATLFVMIGGIVFRFHPWEILLIIIGVWAFVRLFCDFCLFLNLKKPDLAWTDVAALTKQSIPTILSIFGGWAFCIVLGFGGAFLAKTVPAWAVLCAYILLFLILRLVLHTWLKTKGTAILASL